MIFTHALSYVIDNETLIFSFTLVSEEMEMPHIDAGNNIDREIKCEKDENEKTKVVCTPDLVNMDENKLYEIYYEGACGVLKSSDINVQNTNAPVVVDPTDPSGNNPEITIDTESEEFLFMSRTFVFIILFIIV